MPYRMFRGTLESCGDELSGVFSLGPFPASGLPVGGLTLDFLQPSITTVTFTGSGGSLRTLAQIVTDLTTQLALAGAKVRHYGPGGMIYSTDGNVQVQMQQIVMQHDANGIEIDDTGTANAVFKLPASGGSVARAKIANTAIINFGPDASAGHYYIVIEE